MLDEALQVLTGLWTGEPFSHQGEHYRVRDVTFLPAALSSLAARTSSGAMSCQCPSSVQR